MSGPSKGAQLRGDRAKDAIFVDVVSKSPYIQRFRSSSHLAAHAKQVHDKERDVECAECGTAFSTKSSLAAHQRSHLRGGNYR